MSSLGRLFDLRLGERGTVAALFALSLVLGLGLAAIEIAVDTELTGLGVALAPLATALALSTGESAARGAVGKPVFMAAQRPLSPAPRERLLVAVETVTEPATTGLAGELLLMLLGTWLAGSALLFIPAPFAALWLFAAAALARSYRRLG